MHCVMLTLFITKHVALVIRLIIFLPCVNTALVAQLMPSAKGIGGNKSSASFTKTRNKDFKESNR